MKLATFGCSFTSHLYPTWADMLGARFDQHLNLAQCGSGNRCIATKVFDFCLDGAKDPREWVVIVEWSGFNRWDFPTGIQKWFTPGNANYVRWRPDEKIFVDRYLNLEGELDSQLALMLAAHRLLKATEFRHSLFTSMERLDVGLDELNEEARGYVRAKMAKVVDDLVEPSITDFTHSHPENRRYHVQELDMNDGHPTITQHAAYLTKILLPRLTATLGFELRMPTQAAVERAQAIYHAKGVRYSDYARKSETDEWRESMALLSE